MPQDASYSTGEEDTSVGNGQEPAGEGPKSTKAGEGTCTKSHSDRQGSTCEHSRWMGVSKIYNLERSAYIA
jgi:hypothetical protein